MLKLLQKQYPVSGLDVGKMRAEQGLGEHFYLAYHANRHIKINNGTVQTNVHRPVLEDAHANLRAMCFKYLVW